MARISKMVIAAKHAQLYRLALAAPGLTETQLLALLKQDKSEVEALRAKLGG